MKPGIVAQAALGRDGGGPDYNRGSGNQKWGRIQDLRVWFGHKLKTQMAPKTRGMNKGVCADTSLTFEGAAGGPFPPTLFQMSGIHYRGLPKGALLFC